MENSYRFLNSSSFSSLPKYPQIPFAHRWVFQWPGFRASSHQTSQGAGWHLAGPGHFRHEAGMCPTPNHRCVLRPRHTTITLASAQTAAGLVFLCLHKACRAGSSAGPGVQLRGGHSSTGGGLPPGPSPPISKGRACWWHVRGEEGPGRGKRRAGHAGLSLGGRGSAARARAKPRDEGAPPLTQQEAEEAPGEQSHRRGRGTIHAGAGSGGSALSAAWRLRGGGGGRGRGSRPAGATHSSAAGGRPSEVPARRARHGTARDRTGTGGASAAASPPRAAAGCAPPSPASLDISNSTGRVSLAAARWCRIPKPESLRGHVYRAFTAPQLLPG